MIQESEIWERFKSGHVTSFEWIYDRYSKELFKYGCGFSFDQDLVEDCIQELFTSLWQKRASLGVTTSIKFYLLSSLRRMLVRKTSQSKKRELNELEFYEAFRHQSSPESIFILEEEDRILQQQLISALNNLSFRQREVMYLRYYQDMSFDEISQIMEIPKKTAYNIVFIALDMLKKKLNLRSAKFLSLLATILLGHTHS